jgi:hypothetical protein
MPKYKKDIDTTNPVAVQKDQLEYHAPGGEPWHMNAKDVACPDCDVVYIVDQGFSHECLLAQLKDEHAKNKKHPLFVASEPAFTTVSECKCGE